MHPDVFSYAVPKLALMKQPYHKPHSHNPYLIITLLMGSQFIITFKRFGTNVTPIRLMVFMANDMLIQMPVIWEFFTTKLTCENFIMVIRWQRNVLICTDASSFLRMKSEEIFFQLSICYGSNSKTVWHQT